MQVYQNITLFDIQKSRRSITPKLSGDAPVQDHVIITISLQSSYSIATPVDTQACHNVRFAHKIFY
jgi:hypothetical protein